MKEKCVFCGKIIMFGYGNNAMPLKSGRCCDKCNYGKVIPERVRLYKKDVEEK